MPHEGYWVDYYTPLYLTDHCGRQTTLTTQPYGNPDSGNVVLTQVTIQAGGGLRFFTTAVPSINRQWCIGSDGQWVKYTWTSGTNGGLTRADYSDGTFAVYNYGVTT